MRHDPMPVILADLTRRVARLGDTGGRLSSGQCLDEIDAIAHIARRFGLADVEGLAAMLGSAVTLHGLGPILLSYLDLMHDAIAAHGGVGAVVPFLPAVAPAVSGTLHA